MFVLPLVLGLESRLWPLPLVSGLASDVCLASRLVLASDVCLASRPWPCLSALALPLMFVLALGLCSLS